MSEVEKICDVVGIIHHGRLVAEGSLAELGSATGAGHGGDIRPRRRRRGGRMNLHNILTVFLKELRDSLRDRRTLISMIVVPTLMIPGIILVAGVISYKVVRQAQAETPSVMLLGGGDSPAVRGALGANPKFAMVAGRRRTGGSALRTSSCAPPWRFPPASRRRWPGASLRS